MYSVMGIMIILMGISAMRIKFTEDITSFFPDSGGRTAMVFKNLNIKDKIVLMIPVPEAGTDQEADPYGAIENAEKFITKLSEKININDYARLTYGINEDMTGKMAKYIYSYLPLFLTGEDYARLDTVATAEGAEKAMEKNYRNLLSAAGGFMEEYIYTDPLGISYNLLPQLRKMSSGMEYSITDSYIFTKDGSTLLMFFQPVAGKNISPLIDAVEETISGTDMGAGYFGAPAVALYNARRIKKDTMLTLNIAVLIVIIFISLTFRNKWSVLLITAPVIFGGLSALALIQLIQGEISSIAAGSGAVVFGIALSYSIHVLSHAGHCRNIPQLIKEMAYPLTIGSFTTVGAFAGLLFTDSLLLQDFGLFASLTLIGTTLFSLVFLPHFIKISGKGKPNRILSFIEKITGHKWEKNRWLVTAIVILAIVCSFFFNKVGFDTDMMNINYEPEHLSEYRTRLEKLSGRQDGESSVLFIATAEQEKDAVPEYVSLCRRLDSLQAAGDIITYSAIDPFTIPADLQKERLERWNKFWTKERIKGVTSAVNKSKASYGFTKEAFGEFGQLLERKYSATDYRDSLTSGLFADWINTSGSSLMFIAHISLKDTLKETVYSVFGSDKNVVIADRAFYAGLMAKSVNDNFYLVLYISSFLIFFALLISYGRIELTLISFLPMFISWIIILGLMALFSVEFNIVTIILSTFIFGIGDDFSIFIMDGLLGEYKSGRKTLTAHKTAIFFSAFTIIAGMGSLIFAVHPALKSLALISLFGIVAVVLVSYTIQPVIFRSLISYQTAKGGFPYTLAGLLNTVYAFGLFLLGCLLVQLCIAFLFILPLGKIRRKEFVHGITSRATKIFIKAMVTVKMINLNEHGETFGKPAVIIANHQSFIDILLLLGLNRKLVMVTNSWVWKSPFFGKIVRFLDFYHTADGYENLAVTLKEKISQGYSVIIFPEGTRSGDCSIRRFHKGAFYLAEMLQLDILPVLIYGNGLISSKRQPIYIKKGIVVSKILRRIPPGNTEFGTGYAERSKKISVWFREQYGLLYEEFNRPRNKYFYDALIKNYIYKGPVLEWYMRIKVKMERNYALFDKIIPREGFTVDLGCGYGPLPYMLSMLSDKRKILGIDYDREKITVARHCFSKNGRIEFREGDIKNIELPAADTFVLNDVLHYIPYGMQDNIIRQCIGKLNRGGKIIIRDGNSSDRDKHGATELSEKWSTRILKFNKTDGALFFTSSERIVRIASEEGMDIKQIRNDNITSNTIYIITHAG